MRKAMRMHYIGMIAKTSKSTKKQIPEIEPRQVYKPEFNRGIGASMHYPIPPHKQKAFQDWNRLSFPVSELIHEQILSLPMSPVMSEEEAEGLVEAVNVYKQEGSNDPQYSTDQQYGDYT